MCSNPRNDDEGQSGFSGIKPHIQEHDHAHANYVVSSTADVHKAVIELKANPVQVVDGLPNGLEGKTGEINAMGLSGTEAISEKHLDGPNVVKPKSSWTRFNMMDFGLRGLQKVLLPSNGKRPLLGEMDRNQNTKGEEGRTKRGKFENEKAFIIEGSAGVDDHPCQE